ncbi:MAG: UTP--glucose-1-phosphate uridylyltransferase [Oligoflexia bacterium]|nr:UTP--glucose-1-phosphate uridylyltransferase [Oligoflexia bacterium]
MQILTYNPRKKVDPKMCSKSFPLTIASLKLLIETLDLDELNSSYFLSLIEKYKQNKKNNYRLYDKNHTIQKNHPSSDQFTPVFPTAVAPDELLNTLTVASYNEIKKSKEIYEKIAQKIILLSKPMQAGTGSTIERKKYLSKILGISEESVTLGPKGADLYIDIEHEGKKHKANLAEIQIIRSINEALSKKWKKIIFHDIVGFETSKAVKDVWNKPSVFDLKKSYRQLIDLNSDSISYFGSTTQNNLPTIDEQGNLSLNRTAPGGHALFGIEALRAAIFDSTLLPSYNSGNDNNDCHLIGVVGNGEDLGSTPDPMIAGYMVSKNWAIVMITTEKTTVDLKGGQLAIVSNNQNNQNNQKEEYVTIIEQAQAKAQGEDALRLFEEIGLREGDKMAYFNTNVALFNYNILVPKIKALVAEIGESEFMNIITPDLIQNQKTQIDHDKVSRKYIQLEGAMGSVLLNLDRYWRKRYCAPLVNFINIEKEDRTKFFSPIKTAFDFFMLFHSDRFNFDQTSKRLINLRPNALPLVNLNNKFYAEVENVLNTFNNTSIIELDTLHLEGGGIVDFSNCKLCGYIKIDNRSSNAITLRDLQNHYFTYDQDLLVIKDMEIEIEEDGRIKILKMN